ncbi:MAG: LysR family transcriptional regulator [Pseudomonadota bacterium]
MFLAIFDKNSVTLAAEEFNINQSTASHTLDKLRDSFNDPLFVKSGRGIEPTEQAVVLATKIREVLTMMEGFHDRYEYHPSDDNDPITIATNVEFASTIFSRMREKLALEAPDKALRILDLGSRLGLESAFNRHDIDVVVSIRPLKFPNSLSRRQLTVDTLRCYFDGKFRAAPKSLEEYCKARHAVIDFGSADKSAVAEFLDKMNLVRNVVLYVPNFDVIPLLVEGSDMIVTQRSGLADTTFKNLSSCEPPVPFPKVYTDLIWRRRDEKSGRNRWVRNLFD